MISVVSMASHELKTPLSSMRMILPLVLERKVGPLSDKQAELLTVAAGAVERMRQIVETILDLGRLASGKMPLDVQPLRPAELVHRAVATHRAAFEGKGIEMRRMHRTTFRRYEPTLRRSITYSRTF